MGVTYEREDRIATLTLDGRTELDWMAADTVYLASPRPGRWLPTRPITSEG